MRFILPCFCLLLCFVQAHADETVRFEREGESHTVVGTVLVEAADGGVLFNSQDGRIWTIPPSEIVKREASDAPAKPLSQKQMIKEVRAQLPSGFQVHKTAHYLVFFNTSRAYAQWCGSLYERLYRAFRNYWKRRGMKLSEPDVPLVAIVFDNQRQYQQFSAAELGGAPSNVIGFYSLRTNWITTYDLTGVEGIRRPGARAKTSIVINQILSQPAAEPSVATFIHEATHQIAFNSGFQTRYADNPLWLSEGIAVFFEVPDLSSAKGWKRIGAVHPRRLSRFLESSSRRSRGWVKALVTEDKRFRNGDTAIDSYAEAWLLCHFLINRREEAMVEYLNDIGAQPRLIFGTPDDRYRKFVEHFGSTDEIEKALEAYLPTLM